MVLNAADIRAKLIDPAIHKRGWTEGPVRREETTGTVEIINGRGHRRSHLRLSKQHRITDLLREQAVAVERARAAAGEELNAINALPAALLRRAFSGEVCLTNGGSPGSIAYIIFEAARRAMAKST